MRENEKLKKACQEGTIATETLRAKNKQLNEKIKSLRKVIAEEKT